MCDISLLLGIHRLDFSEEHPELWCSNTALENDDHWRVFRDLKRVVSGQIAGAQWQYTPRSIDKQPMKTQRTLNAFE